MTINDLLRRSLKWGAIFAAALVVVASVVGYLVAGLPGLWGALLAALLTAVFLGLTAVSILIANRVAKGPQDMVVFFAIVLGGWLLKFVLFLIVALPLRDAEWLQPAVFGVTVIVAVVGSLVIDMVAVAKSRIPVVETSGSEGDR